jgi:hypothetical protein
MKKNYIVGLIFVAITLSSCDVLTQIPKVNLKQNLNTILPPAAAPALSNEEVISGLKEALNVGIKNASSLTSITDGFLKNEAIRLPFPPDAIKVKEKALNLGLTKQVDKFETKLNRAAEEATK